MTYDQLIAFLARRHRGLLHRRLGHAPQVAAGREQAGAQPRGGARARALRPLGVSRDADRRRAAVPRARRGGHREHRGAAQLRPASSPASIEPIVRLAVEAVTPLAPHHGRAARGAGALSRGAHRARDRATRRARSEALRDDAADLAVATMLGIDAANAGSAALRERAHRSPSRARDHPLARGGAPDPAGAPARARRRSSCATARTETESPSLNVLEGGLRWSVTDVAAKKEIIAAGMGWGGLPEHVIAPELASGALVVARGAGVRGRRDGALRDAAARSRARRRRAGAVAGADVELSASTAEARGPTLGDRATPCPAPAP